MRNRTLSVDGRLLALHQVHHDLIEQLSRLQKLRGQLRTAERRAWPSPNDTSEGWSPDVTVADEFRRHHEVPTLVDFSDAHTR